MSAPIELSPELRARMLAPPPVTVALPGVGGRLRARPEDFVVDEIPAYGPDGREERHLLVRLRKRGLPTTAAAREIAQHCGVDLREVGLAGRKDADALTTQWISLPWEARGALESFDHSGVQILEVHPHGQKLRTGHLHGNRFEIVLRDLEVGLDEAQARVRAKLDALTAEGGLDNLFGPQRFGRDGANLERGLRALTGRRIGHRERFVASAAQAGLFNLYVGLRREQGWMRVLLPGDLVRKLDSGGVFEVEDAAAEQPRLDAGEIGITGPLPGAKSRRPAPGTAAAQLEDEVMRRVGLVEEQLQVHGKKLSGSRRACQLPVDAVEVEVAPAVDDLGPGLLLRFTMGAGSFATQLTRELQVGPDTQASAEATSEGTEETV